MEPDWNQFFELVAKCIVSNLRFVFNIVLIEFVAKFIRIRF